MDSYSSPTNSPENFAFLTPRLILLPTPTAISQPSYRSLYSELHSDPAFCEMAFGDHFPPRTWDDEETRAVIETRDIECSWKKRGLGDFAVGLRESPGLNKFGDDYCAQMEDSGVVVVTGDEFASLAGPNNERLADLRWVGYAGVRDATTTSIPSNAAYNAVFPPWREMVELRYGISPHFWGKGIAAEASKAVMQWAVGERGVKRFIAETERHNIRSERLLEKLGFASSGTNYWEEASEVEWEFVVE
ncbi:hypothetical protein PHISP_00758 [Aspergillus sp. HF37]|nr:hypothetical protein PHISP_00758 [Aspergillus sp. HF37]